MEFTNETDTTYTVVSPLTLSNNAISLSTLTSLGTANQILKVNSGGTALEFTNETDTTYSAGTNINLSGTTINLDTTLTNLVSINTFKIGGNANSEITLLTNNGNLFNGDYLKINIGGKVIGQNTKDTKNNILGITNTTGVIAGTNMSKSLNTTTGDITLSSTDTTYTVSLPLTLSAANKIGLDGLTSYGNANQILKMNATGTALEWSNEQDISGFITASSTTTFTNKSMSYGQVTSRPFEVNYPSGLLFANYLSIFKTVSDRCILFSNSSSNYRHGIKHNDNNLEFYLSTTNDNFTGLNKKLTIGLTSIQPTVDISLLAIGNSTGVSQIIRFNNDNLNTIGANFTTLVGNAGGMEIKGFAVIESSITRTDTTKNMRTILSNNGFHVLKGDLSTDKTLLLLRDNATNQLGNVSNNLIIDGYDISIGSASNIMKLRSQLLEFYYGSTTTLVFRSQLYDSKYEFEAANMRCPGELNMRNNSTLGRINMCDGAIYYRNRYKSGENTYVTDYNHYSQYSSSPVDGIRHQGWNGVSLGYTNGGPGTALYTTYTGVYFGNGTAVSSDDRIKFNETKITYNALETINKLVVVEYDKKYNRDLPETQYGEEMENHLLNDTQQKEYGYIAQDTWNNIPELRFTIKNVDTTIPENFDENGLLIEDCKIRNSNSEGEEFIDRKYLSIDYNNINVLNVRAVQELSEIVKQQQIIIDKLINSTTFANFKNNI